MQLRWSFALLSLSCIIYSTLAVPIPGKGDNPKDTSQVYRGNAQSGPVDFQHTPGGVNYQAVLNQGTRAPRPFEDADHLLEAQTLLRALRDQNVQYRDLPMHHQAGLRQILNHPHNMAFVNRSYNRGKGQVVRQGQDGNALSTNNPSRDSYIRQTIPSAHHTAQQLDNYLVQNGYQGNVAHTFRNAMENAGHLTPGRPIPPPIFHQAAGPSGIGGLTQQVAGMNIHGSGSSSSSPHSSPSVSVPGSPTPGSHLNLPPVTPARNNHHQAEFARLGTHAPQRPHRVPNALAERYGNVRPIPLYHELHPPPPVTHPPPHAVAGPSTHGSHSPNPFAPSPSSPSTRLSTGPTVDPRLRQHVPSRIPTFQELHPQDHTHGGTTTPPSTPHPHNAVAGPSHLPHPVTPPHQTGGAHGGSHDHQSSPHGSSQGHHPSPPATPQRRNSFNAGTPAATRPMIHAPVPARAHLSRPAKDEANAKFAGQLGGKGKKRRD